MIIAILIPVDGQPQTVTLDNTLTAFQQKVEGYLEALTLERPSRNTPGVILYFNEEGRMRNLAFNMRLAEHNLYGALLIVGCDARGDAVNLTAEQVRQWTQIVKSIKSSVSTVRQ